MSVSDNLAIRSRKPEALITKSASCSKFWGQEGEPLYALQSLYEQRWHTSQKGTDLPLEAQATSCKGLFYGHHAKKK